MKLEKNIKLLKKKLKKKFFNKHKFNKGKVYRFYGIIELVDYIENTLKLKCPSTKISTSNFNSIF